MRRRSATGVVIAAILVCQASTGHALSPASGGALTPDLIKEDLYDTHFVSEQRGWVVGTFGRIFLTDDGGRTWTRQASGTSAPLFSADFADARHGWIVGKSGTILATADGGEHWQKQQAPVGKHLFAVTAVSPQVAWAVGDWGVRLSTADGGATWHDRSLEEDIILYGVDFADQTHGWIVGETGVMFHTADGGQSWAQAQTETKKSLFAVHLSGSRDGWAVGLDGEIWRTTDGAAWTRQPSGVDSALYGVAFAGALGWVVGNHGTALVSHDRGSTWRRVNVPDDLKLFWIHAVNVEETPTGPRGIIAGANGLMLWTRDDQIVAR